MPETIASTSRVTDEWVGEPVEGRPASISMRANRGSIGMREISRPIRVRCGDPSLRDASTAPSSVSRSNAAFTPRESGGVRNGNAVMSPKPSDSICRMTEASEVRRISGSVYSGRLS